MSQPVIRVVDGRHQVGVTETGIDWLPVGEPFGSPRAAIDFSDRLEADATTSAGATDPAPDTVARNATLVRTDAGRGGPTPLGRRGRCRPRSDSQRRALKRSTRRLPLDARAASLRDAVTGDHSPGL